MVSIGDIRAWQPGELDSAFGALGARRDSLIGLDDQLLAARAPDGWTGEAARTATAAHPPIIPDPAQAQAVQRERTLAEFYRGIDASRATNPHLTALGHSYGSTTTGFALQENTGVDDAVFFGSPGLGTSHIEDIQVPEGHTYRIEARNDVAADAGQFGIDPTYADGVTGLSAREATLPDGRRLVESTGHSAYLVQESTSQYNLSVVVAGLGDRRVEDDGRGLGDIASWPVPVTY